MLVYFVTLIDLPPYTLKRISTVVCSGYLFQGLLNYMGVALTTLGRFDHWPLIEFGY